MQPNQYPKKVLAADSTKSAAPNGTAEAVAPSATAADFAALLCVGDTSAFSAGPAASGAADTAVADDPRLRRAVALIDAGAYPKVKCVAMRNDSTHLSFRRTRCSSPGRIGSSAYTRGHWQQQKQ